MMDNFVVVGAGVTGMTAAHELSRLGADVAVVERSSMVGGHVSASRYCCKATTSCSRCGVCVAHSQLNATLLDPRVRVQTSSVLETFASVDGGVSLTIRQRQPAIDYEKCTACDACITACPEECIAKYDRAEITQYSIDYDTCLKNRGEACRACADACSPGAISCEEGDRTSTIRARALLIAAGHTPFDAAKKPRYGYGRSSRIMTGLEAEAALSSDRNFGDPGERIAFVQCVGSRDPSIGRNFCSGVCCAYAVRMARMMKHGNRDMKVTVFYIDLQNFDRQFTSLLAETRELGVEFVQGLPFMIEQEADGSIALTVESTNGSEEKVRYDRVILSVGIDERDGSAELSATVGLEKDGNGFLQSRNPLVYTCGTCAGPMNIPESMAAARETAHTMWAGSGT